MTLLGVIELKALTLMIFLFGPLLSSSLWAQILPNNRISKPYFYRLTKEHQVHYLLGTFHSVLQWQDFPKRVHNEFAKATNVVMETEYDDKWRTYLKISIEQLGANRLKPPSYLSKENIQKLHDLGLPPELLPYIPNESCFLFIYYLSGNRYPFYTMDADIYLKAKDAGKRTFKLNTKEILEAAKAQYSRPLSCTVSGMLDQLGTEEILDLGRNQINGYLAGDQKGDDNSDPSADYRNERWIPQILEAFQNGSSFVAVGAYHLWGEKGLIHLLKNQGYNIERL